MVVAQGRVRGAKAAALLAPQQLAQQEVAPATLRSPSPGACCIPDTAELMIHRKISQQMSYVHRFSVMQCQYMYVCK